MQALKLKSGSAQRSRSRSERASLYARGKAKAMRQARDLAHRRSWPAGRGARTQHRRAASLTICAAGGLGGGASSIVIECRQREEREGPVPHNAGGVPADSCCRDSTISSRDSGCCCGGGDTPSCRGPGLRSRGGAHTRPPRARKHAPACLVPSRRAQHASRAAPVPSCPPGPRSGLGSDPESISATNVLLWGGGRGG